jgi:hypothetical protein
VALAQTEVIVSITPTGGDYTSLVAWEAGEEDDLVALNQNHIAEISGAWATDDLGPVVVDGWVTDGTRFVTIRTTGAARHAGVFPALGSGPYVLTCNPTDNTTLDLWESYTVLDGLCVRHNSQNNTYDAISAGYLSSIFTFKSCLAKCMNPSPTSQSGFSVSYPLNAASYLINCVADGFDNGFIISQSTLGVFVNCLSLKSGTGFGVQGGYENVAVPTWINCVSIGTTTIGFYSGTYGGLSDYNISDFPGETPAGANSKNGTVLLVDSANGDYHLSPSDTQARAFCPPYTGNAGIVFTTDYESHERGATTWDAGADEFGSSPTPLGHPQVIIISE